MAGQLDGKLVAILVEEGFEEVELIAPRQALTDADARTHVISPHFGVVKGWNHTDWGGHMSVDKQLDEADASEYDALLLPGGVMNPDKLRVNPAAQDFVRAFFEAGKPVAAICHAPWTLINTGVVAGRTLTSYPTLRVDLENAGANWVDEEVVVDNGLVTSRNPDDIPAFNRKMIEEIAEGVHMRQQL